ncbi:MAG: HAD-IIA family hydrolase [Candidatus Atribacteria bacterium]|nr:HAD-IIA family hydrolase [Candidatus Atribacteria bacterium]
MIAEHFRVFLFDLDGVIWRGGELIADAREVVMELRRMGKFIRFLTNNPRWSREEIRERLVAFGIDAALEEVVTASWATAWYLRERGFKTGYILGSNSLKEELKRMGIIEEERFPQVVVVGYDEHISFGEIAWAVRFVERGAELVATNPDVVFTLPEGKVPATGSVVKVIESLSGCKATVIGKPSPYIFELLFQGLGNVERSDMALVGDSIETDIQGAHGVGIAGILYVTKDTVLPSLHGPSYPDMVITHLGCIVGMDPAPPKKQAVGALIRDQDNRILCIRRRDNHLWCLPTGKVEPNESEEEEAVRRELQEELGIGVEIWGLRAVYLQDPALHFRYPNGDWFHFVVFLFEGSFLQGSVRPCPEEVEEWGFFPENGLPSPFFHLHQKWIREMGGKNKEVVL